MIRQGFYTTVRDIAIGKLGYQIDYFDPIIRMTLLHTIAKYRRDPWSKEEVSHITWIISNSNNVLITNNFGSNCIRTCKNCNVETNFTVFQELITKKMWKQMTKIQVMVMKRLQDKTHFHRYVVREVYKYIDG